MNLQQRINRLNDNTKRRVKGLLYRVGCDNETVNFMIKEGKVRDIVELVGYDELMELEG